MNEIDKIVDDIFELIEDKNTDYISTRMTSVNGKCSFFVNDKEVTKEEYLKAKKIIEDKKYPISVVRPLRKFPLLDIYF